MMLNLKLDADGGNSSLKSNSINVLSKILSENNLIDIWWVCHPPRRAQVYLAKITPLLQRRLDYFFLSNILQENIQKVDTLPGIQSDHFPVLVQLKTSTKRSMVHHIGSSIILVSLILSTWKQ